MSEKNDPKAVRMVAEALCDRSMGKGFWQSGAVKLERESYLAAADVAISAFRAYQRAEGQPGNECTSAPTLQVSLQSPKGCICPPTSEAFCKRWDCGRKSIGLNLGGTAT
jgi:hypothetical protein